MSVRMPQPVDRRAKVVMLRLCGMMLLYSVVAVVFYLRGRMVAAVGIAVLAASLPFQWWAAEVYRKHRSRSGGSGGSTA
jgi:NADH:ubiquinone oxidoreductase subunit 2 (subunit N)